MTPQRYIEDVWPGDEVVEEVRPTTEDVIRYRDLGGADRGEGSRFTDVASARREGLDGPIVVGAMSMALLTRVVTDWMGPLGRLRSIEVSFRRLVRHGDRLRATALVTDASEEDGASVALLDVYFENERGERPVQGTAVVELPRRGPGSPDPSLRA